MRSEVQIFPGPPTLRARARNRCGRIAHDGAVAQLGERLLCKQEVIGSIPFGSTSLRARFWPLEKERKLRARLEDLRIVDFVLWLFDIVDRMQSTFGRKFTRACWRLLVCGDEVGFGQCTSK